MIPDSIVKELGLPKVAQIGYVVADLSEAIAFCRDAFGMRPWLVQEERPEPCVQRGEEVHPVLKIALTYAGPVQIELIEVLEGETFHLDHVREAKEGPHHLGFTVPDVDKRLDACRSMGIGVIQRGTIHETGFVVVDYAYLDTVDRAGIVLELIRWHLGPISVPFNRSLFNFVCRLGSRTLFRGRVVG